MVQQLQHRMTVWHRMVYDQATNPLAVVQVVHLKKWHYESLGKTNCNPKSPKLCPKHRPSDPPNGRFQDLFHEDGCLTGDVAYVACMPWPKNPQTRLGPTGPDSARLGPWPDAPCMVRPACSACVYPNLLRHKAPGPSTAPRCICLNPLMAADNHETFMLGGDLAYTTSRIISQSIIYRLVGSTSAALAVQPAPGTRTR
jgi:hypothetical protein